MCNKNILTPEEVEQWLSEPIYASEDMYPDDADKLAIHDILLEQEYEGN